MCFVSLQFSFSLHQASSIVLLQFICLSIRLFDISAEKPIRQLIDINSNRSSIHLVGLLSAVASHFSVNSLAICSAIFRRAFETNGGGGDWNRHIPDKDWTRSTQMVRSSQSGKKIIQITSSVSSSTSSPLCMFRFIVILAQPVRSSHSHTQTSTKHTSEISINEFYFLCTSVTLYSRLKRCYGIY